jgi:hypothetical protein
LKKTIITIEKKIDLKGKIKKYKNFEKKNRWKKKREIKSRRTELKNIIYTN